MKVDFQKNGKKAAIGVGLGIAGAMLGNLIANNAPESVKKFADVGTLALGVVGLASDNEYAQAVGTGACAMAGINLVQKHLVQKVPQMAAALPPLAEPKQEGTGGLGELEELEQIQMLGIDDDYQEIDDYQDYQEIDDYHDDYQVSGIDEDVNLMGFNSLLL